MNTEYITLTKEILEQGKSLNGAWSRKQLQIFGVWKKRKLKTGWKYHIIGKSYSRKKIDKFLSLKDVHIVLKEIFGEGENK